MSACKHKVSGSISLPSRGSFQLSLTVLCAIGHQVVFSLMRWSSHVPTRLHVSCGTLVPQLLHYWFNLRDYYSILSNFPVVFGYQTFFTYTVLTPSKRISSVWALSHSLTTTNEIVITFFSSRYLDVSVPWVPLSHTIDSYGDTATLLAVSFLIRKSTDHSLFATTRSLSQLVTSFFGA